MWQQDPDGRVSHPFEPLLLALTLLVIPVVIIEESHAPHWVKVVAYVANWVIWLGFLAEVVTVLVVADRKRDALKAYWLETLVVLGTAPFYPRLLSSARLLRLTRLLRLARLGLLGGIAIRLERSLTSRQGFRYLALATAFLVVTAGAAISVVDSADIPDIGTGMWWAIVTVTTVGYGDVVPHNTAGRIVGAILMLLGIGFISLLTATIASTFIASDEEEDTRLDELVETVRRIEQRLDQLGAGG
jgi:voltage-gated potassium channel